MSIRDWFTAPEGKYPLGNPEGTPRQRLWWKLGFRRVPTPEERMLGAALLFTGGFSVVAGLSQLL